MECRAGYATYGGDVSEVEFSCDQEEDGSDGVKADAAARLAFCCWKQAVDGLDKAIGLTSLVGRVWVQPTIPSK
jgi:hypothetical protein